MANIFTLDIGGAFIKWTEMRDDRKPKSGSLPFEMYRYPEKLATALRELKPSSQPDDVAITMTGELCDSFEKRQDGVRHIVKSAERVFGNRLKVFSRNGELLSAAEAIKRHGDVASTNWMLPPLELSSSSANFLLVDIGSTTTDFTSVQRGNIESNGFDDMGRLQGGELLYTGYLRTPIQSVCSSVWINGRETPFSSEYFSIMADVYTALGWINPSGYLCPTPDGRGTDKSASLSRLARSVLSERHILGDYALFSIAEQLEEAQRKSILKQIEKFSLKVIAIGRGAFILDKLFESGAIEAHSLHASDRVDKLDPSRALAFLMRVGKL